MGLVDDAKNFTHVFVIVCDNDAKSVSANMICKKFFEFQKAIYPTDVKFACHMRRKDIPQELVASNNMFFRNKLGFRMKSTKIIRREDFDDNKKYHFDPNGEGFRHMAALILSVFREFTVESSCIWLLHMSSIEVLCWCEWYQML